MTQQKKTLCETIERLRADDHDREVYMAGKWCPPLAQNQQHAEPRPGERVVLWCLYDPDANEAKPWRVQWKEGGEKMGTRKGRDDVRVKA